MRVFDAQLIDHVSLQGVMPLSVHEFV